MLSRTRKRNIEQVHSHVDKHMEPYDGSHDISHINRVCSYIDIFTQYDSIPFRISCLIVGTLHDVIDSKYSYASNIDTIETLLHNLNTSDISNVILALKNISYSKLSRDGPPQIALPALKIWRIVSDCDMLDALGAIGCIRTLMYQGYTEKSAQEGMDYIGTRLIDRFEYIENIEAKKIASNKLQIMQEWITGYKGQNVFWVELSEHCIFFGLQKMKFLDALYVINAKYFGSHLVKCIENELDVLTLHPN